MDFVSVGQASRLLNVDPSRVRQLLQEGRLRGTRIGGRWLVDVSSVQDRKKRAPRPGRPLSAKNAWGVLALLAGQKPSGLSGPERSRLLARLRNVADNRDVAAVRLQTLLAARAEVHRYRVHRGALPSLLDDPDVVRAGASAAPTVGADYVAPGRAEVYVHPDHLAKLEHRFGLVPDIERANLVVRVPPASAWSFLTQYTSQGRDVPASVVAADLLDAHEDRASVAAVGILETLLDSFALKARGVR